MTKTDRNGTITTYSYDSLNRLVQRVSGSGVNAISENYHYDLHGDMDTASNDQMSYSLSYDLKHRPQSKTDNRVARSLIYSYDPVGNIATKTDYQGDVTDYRYDSANRLIAEHNPAYLEVSYQYDGAGRLLNRLLSNGAQTAYSYDSINHLSRLTNTSANGLVVNDTLYTRDRIGNFLKQVTTANATSTLAGTTTFTYDPLYRVTKAIFPYGTESFDTYDAVGNRKKATFAAAVQFQDFDVDNRLLAIHATTATGVLKYAYVYDNNGNLTRQCAGGAIIPASTTSCSGMGSTITDYSWDAKGRLASVTGNAITTTYSYDPFDQRIGKVDSQGNQLYMLEGDKLEALYTSAGDLKAKYFRGSVIDEVVNGYQVNTAGVMSNYTFHHDALQSVLGLTSHTGSILDSYRYSSFGNELTPSTAGTNNPLHYTGREFDSGTNLYYYRARYYDPLTGRFISEDPMGFGAGVNFYAYCLNDPVNCNDPTGNLPNSLGNWFTAGQSAAGVITNGATVIGGGALVGAGGTLFATPTGVGQVAGLVTMSVGAIQVTKGIGGVALNASNFMDNWDNQPSSLPSSLPRYVAESYAPGNLAGLAVADAIDVGSDIASLKVPFNGYFDNAANFVTQNTLQASNWLSASNTAANWPGVSVGMPGNTLGSYTNIFGTVGGAATNAWSWITGSACTTCNSAADGGFVLYPNKSNTNQMQSVYHK